MWAVDAMGNMEAIAHGKKRGRVSDDFELRNIDNDEDREVSTMATKEDIIPVRVTLYERVWYGEYIVQGTRPTSCWLCWLSLSLHDFEILRSSFLETLTRHWRGPQRRRHMLSLILDPFERSAMQFLPWKAPWNGLAAPANLLLISSW